MNLTPSATKTIPHEAFYGTTAHKLAQQLRVFRCLAWVHVQQKDQQGKYGARAKPAIMIGYDNKHKAWKFCNPDQPMSIQWSNSATFHEDKGWRNHQQETFKPMVTTEVEEEGVMPTTVAEETRSEAMVEDLLPAIDSTVGTANTAVLNLDPTLGEAMNSEDAQLWKEAIQKELEGLKAMGTWEVVHQPPGVPLVDSKVVLRLKLDADGMPVKHKVQLVARGCHGPKCSGSRRVAGSYGRSTGIEDLVEISREHGRSAVSMETMDSYGLTCKGGPSTATRRTKLKEQAQPRRGPSSRSMQMVTTQGLERQEPKELPLIKGGGAGSKESTPGHEEEEQCQRSRHQVMRRRSSVEGVDTTQEAQGCQAGEALEQYSMKRVLSGERAGAASLAML
ncbi:hypothetical protein NDA17_003904 [Ustilago hordei]|nr:hypothetical protein NDA17_003904 [Ustilago hordei]